MDWYNRTYELTGDDMVEKPVPVELSGGYGTVTGPDLGPFDQWDVEIQQVVEGALPDLGDVTAVLFKCSPQPANFSTQELRIYWSEYGNEVGRIPTILDDNERPQFDPETVYFGDDFIGSVVKFYAPGDPHSAGPTILRNLTWGWNGQEFERQS